MPHHPHAFEPLEPRTLLAAGDLDPSFGVHGVFAYPDIPGPAIGIATQSDGKYVVATHTTLYRFRASGKIDKSFGHRGHVTPGFTLYGVGIDHNGRIAVGGGTADFKWAAARYNPDGTPDLTFNGTGQIITHAGPTATDERASVMALQPDGKILVGGTQFNGNNDINPNFDYNAVVVRFNTNGAVDTSFGASGEAFDSPVFNAVNAIALAPNGDIAIAGRTDAGQSIHDRYFQVVDSTGRFLTGTPASDADPTVFSAYRAACYRPDGARVLADEVEGFSNVYFNTQRVEVVLDPLDRGGYNDEKINAIVTTSDNKTLLAGASRGAGLIRFNSDGTPDSTFGFGGISDLQLNRRKSEWIDRLALLPNGDYLAAGTIGGSLPAESDDSGYLFVAHIQGGAHPVGNLPPRAAANFPTASAPAPGAPAYEFDVSYAAEESIDLASIDSYDIRVVGPHGYSVLARPVARSDRYAGRQRISTYSINAPTGAWNRADNGRYTIYLRPNQVTDNFHHPVPPGVIGAFTLHLPKGRHSPATAAAATTTPITPALAPAPSFLLSPRKPNDLFTT